MKKGFTLIELLAVIVILGVLALITVPIVFNLISNSQKNAFKDTGYSLVKASLNYQMSKQEENENSTLNLDFSNSADRNVLTIKGDLPDGGELNIDENGKVELALWNEKLKVCVVKSKNAKEVRINEAITSKSLCTISNINRV